MTCLSCPCPSLFALIPARDFVLPSLNPSPLGRDFEPPEIPPVLGEYLGAISSHDTFEPIREAS